MKKISSFFVEFLFLFFECISQQISFFDKGVKVTIVNQTCNSLGDGSLEIMLANPLGVIESIVYDTELNTLLQSVSILQLSFHADRNQTDIIFN